MRIQQVMGATFGLPIRWWRSGGQGIARRNAWLAMVDDSIATRGWQAAERAMSEALAAAESERLQHLG